MSSSDAGAGFVLTAVAAGAGLRVCSFTTGADVSLPALTMRVGLGLPAAPVEGRADRAEDAELLDAVEVAAPVCPESSGAALATAEPAPAAISRPAPTANPNVVIRPARLLDFMLAPPNHPE